MRSLADIRREYTQGGLQRESLNDDPISQFETWLEQAIDAGLPDPSAMTVATVDQDGQPSQRIVLLKDIQDSHFIFYTNLGSNKAQDLADNQKISLHFPWHAIERQVSVKGTAYPLSSAQVASYFLSRPKESQLAAWASQQSRPISTRQALMGKFQEIKQRFSQGDISLPPFWGGFRIAPHSIEFWQGGEHRLHDRFVYTQEPGHAWQIERLMP